MKTNRKSLAFLPDWSRDNPYQKLLYQNLIELGFPSKGLSGTELTFSWLRENRESVKFLHFHWLFGVYDPDGTGLNWEKARIFLLKVIVAKALGYKILWTVHNFVSHEPSHLKMEMLLRKTMARLADKVIVHCNYAKDLVHKEWHINQKKICVIPHGSYIGCYPNEISSGEAREKLGIAGDEYVFLFFGTIRNYKGLRQLLDSFSQVAEVHPKARLVIAGKPFGEAIRTDLEKTVVGKKISLFLRFVQDEEVQIFFNASDVVVLPYQNILTSGAALLALSFGKPLIVPSKGCIPEVVDDTNGFPYQHDRELSETMLRAIRRGIDSNMKENALLVAKKLSWSALTQNEYSTLLSSEL